MKRAFLHFTLIAFLSCLSFSTWSYVILLDPGHGGEDQGASVNAVKWVKKGVKQIYKVYEKDLSLKIAKLIAKKLEKKRYQVYLTRSFDRTVSLESRAEMADKLNADLFISIHLNSSPFKRSHGSETYYLDNKSNAAVNKVEEVENQGLEGDALIVHQIITDLVVEKTVESSKKLATSIHKEVGHKIRRHKITDRGVKAGMFFVLALSKRPGVLLEVGFLSNPKELKKLMNSKFQNSYANAVVRGIDKFVSEFHKNSISLL